MSATSVIITSTYRNDDSSNDPSISAISRENHPACIGGESYRLRAQGAALAAADVDLSSAFAIIAGTNRADFNNPFFIVPQLDYCESSVDGNATQPHFNNQHFFHHHSTES
jgi:hypothetical protein